MDRIKFLLVAWIAILLAAFPCGGVSATAEESSAQCSQGELRAGLCDPPEATGEFNNGGVDLSAGYEHGSGGADQNDGIGIGNGNDGDDGNGGGEVLVDNNGGAADGPFQIPIVRDDFTINCAPGTPCDPNLVVQISDLVNFRPITPTQGMEPNGWTVIGLPTNFVAGASVHTLSGSLLGFPADVRFTPASYRWDYGDGGHDSSSTGGATWAALNLPEFSETATSHSYRETGSFTITLRVSFAAEYRFGGQTWRNVRGTLAVPTSPLTVVAGEARTVLVDRECTRNPSGPGC